MERLSRHYRHGGGRYLRRGETKVLEEEKVLRRLRLSSLLLCESLYLFAQQMRSNGYQCLDIGPQDSSGWCHSITSQSENSSKMSRPTVIELVDYLYRKKMSWYAGGLEGPQGRRGYRCLDPNKVNEKPAYKRST